MLQLDRKKERNLLLSIIYKLGKITPINKKLKFSLFSNLSWIFKRLAFETSNEITTNNHDSKVESVNFFSKHLIKSDNVIDIGCGSGELTYLISQYCNKITGLDSNNQLILNANNKYKNKNINFLNKELLSINTIKDIDDYNVFMLSHVLEHVENTKDNLSVIKKNAFKIFIEVPDFESDILNKFRKKNNLAINYTDDDHIYEFERNYLSKIFKSIDLHIIAFEARDGVLRYCLSRNKEKN